MNAAQTRLINADRVATWIISLIVVVAGVGLMSGCAGSTQSQSESQFSKQQFAANGMNQNRFDHWGDWAEPGWPF